jgi:kynureninase
LVEISPEQGEVFLSTKHILETIADHAATTALLLLPGIQYYTGQAFDIATITQYAHSKGIVVGWDLAHAVGNIELKLHEWNVDFAAWCSYKYLNAGPGGIGGLFVHESAKDRKTLRGWWGHEESSRFNMTNSIPFLKAKADIDFIPIMGAGGYQLSNPSVLDMMALRASLEVFSKTDMSALRQKSIALTGYLEHVLQPLVDQGYFTIITPRTSEDRGAQLSLFFDESVMMEVYERLGRRGVVCDDRKPNVIRVSPAPLYNTFEEIWEFVMIFRKVLADLRSEMKGIGDV